MKISNKAFIIGIAVIVVALISWSWMKQNDFFTNVELENQTTENVNAQIEVQEEIPRVRITFPSNQVILNPGPISVSYILSGTIDEVNRVELILYKKGDAVVQRTGSFNPESKMGSQLFPSLEEGEYRLLARLVKNDGTYYSSMASEYSVMFQVREATITNN